MARTRDFADVIRARLAAEPELAAAVAKEAFNAEIARKIYELRTAAGLTQKQLAERVGTRQSVISRLEDADYDGHSLALLKRIADAVGKKLRVEFDAQAGPGAERVTEYTPEWPCAEWRPLIEEAKQPGAA
jgi:transcriptional regulator with XRE-family HTH domain